MIQLDIKQEDLQELQRGRFTQPHHRVMQKYDALGLNECGLTNTLICKIFGICNNTLLSFIKQYNEGGLPKRQEINFYRPQSEMAAFSGTIETYFIQNPPAAKIEELTGVKRGETQIRKFLKDHNFRFRKVGTVPAKVQTEEKKRTKRILVAKLTPRLDEAKDGERIVCFVDAAHFVFGAFVACLWCLTRIFVPTPSGRNRYNVIGAIDAVSHDLVTVCNTTYINAESVCGLLVEIAEKQRESKLPITLVLDNAKYQHCGHVMNKAGELGLELLFLPSYSPNLNIIERLWKWTKKDCLNCRYYAKFSDFVDSINKSLQKIGHKENRDDLNILLTLDFQLYDNSIYGRV